MFLIVSLLFVFLTGFSFILGLMPLNFENRPKLKLQTFDFQSPGVTVLAKKKKSDFQFFGKIFRSIAVFNKVLVSPVMRQQLTRDMAMGRVELTPEEFMLIRELILAGSLWAAWPVIQNPEVTMPMICIIIASSYLAPSFWLKGRVKKVKDSIIRDLPDTVDLLALCVNAGLDFMMALKYLVEKSPPTIIMEELGNMMQEINVGKPRREALRALAKKYELPDLSTFARTLIQADRMGTSVSEALNILSEDMRETRFRRGEAMALKAPLKMLVPLLLFIFPVVGILVAGPIMLQFMQNSPLDALK